MSVKVLPAGQLQSPATQLSFRVPPTGQLQSPATQLSFRVPPTGQLQSPATQLSFRVPPTGQMLHSPATQPLLGLHPLPPLHRRQPRNLKYCDCSEQINKCTYDHTRKTSTPYPPYCYTPRRRKRILYPKQAYQISSARLPR